MTTATAPLPTHCANCGNGCVPRDGYATYTLPSGTQRRVCYPCAEKVERALIAFAASR